VGSFHWLRIHRLSSVNWFVLPLIRGGKTTLRSASSPIADLSELFRMQECRFTTPQDAGIIGLSKEGWDTHSSALGLQAQVYACNPSTGEAETGGSGVQGQLELHSKKKKEEKERKKIYQTLVALKTVSITEMQKQ
jgi:hypothetical protein